MRTVNQPKVDRRVDFPPLHLCSDFGKAILPKFPQEYHLFVRMFGDAVCSKCVALIAPFPLNDVGDLFDFMLPFFGLFRLLQSLVSRTRIRSLIVLLTASVALDVVPIWVVVASEGDGRLAQLLLLRGTTDVRAF